MHSFFSLYAYKIEGLCNGYSVCSEKPIFEIGTRTFSPTPTTPFPVGVISCRYADLLFKCLGLCTFVI